MDRKLNYRELCLRLAHALMNAGAVLTCESNHPRVVTRGTERGFQLKLHEKDPSAPLSPIFFNLRTADNPNPGPLTAEIVTLAAECMHGLADREALDYNAVAGIPRAGDPFASAFAPMLFSVPLVTMEKVEIEGKRHIGAVVGNVSGGTTVLLVDDLITKADSKLEAIGNLQSAGLVVNDVMVLLDREQGGREQLAEHGIMLYSIFTIRELLDLYVQSGKMDRGLVVKIKEYLVAN